MPNGQFPNILAGTNYPAALLMSMLEQGGWKTIDSPLTLHTALIADADLVVPVSAGGMYFFVGSIAYTAAAGTGDMAAGFTIPSGTLQWSCMHYNSSNVLGLDTVTSSGQTLVFEGAGASIRSAMFIGGALIGATPGNLQWEWAQNVSSATSTILKAGSVLLARQIG